MPVIKEVSKGGNVIYYINEQKGTVVAKVLSDPEEAFDVAESIVRKIRRSDTANSPFYVESDRRKTNVYGLADYYIGIAKCSPEDSFDVETGKRVALAKAQVKYHTDLHARLAKMPAYLCELSQQIERRTVLEHEQILRYQNEIANGGIQR